MCGDYVLESVENGVWEMALPQKGKVKLSSYGQSERMNFPAMPKKEEYCISALLRAREACIYLLCPEERRLLFSL